MNPDFPFSKTITEAEKERVSVVSLDLPDALTLVFIEPAVLAVTNPESPASLLPGNGLGRVQRDNDDGGLNALERSGVLGGVGDNLLASLGPDIAVGGGESSNGVRVGVRASELYDLLEKATHGRASARKLPLLRRARTYTSSSFSLNQSPFSSTTGTSKNLFLRTTTTWL